MASKVHIVDDPARSFAKAVLVRRDGKELTAADLHAAFARRAEQMGKEALSPATVGHRLTAVHFKRVKRGGRSTIRVSMSALPERRK